MSGPEAELVNAPSFVSFHTFASLNPLSLERECTQMAQRCTLYCLQFCRIQDAVRIVDVKMRLTMSCGGGGVDGVWHRRPTSRANN